MAEYIIQKQLGDGSWTRGEDFSAGNEEEAKQKAIEIIARQRLHYGNSRIRIMKVVFEGLPHETGYQLPHNEVYEELEAKQTAEMTNLWLKLKSMTLDDYEEKLYFVLKAVPEVLDGAGRDLRLLYAAGEGFMGYASKEEVEHARDVAKLSPGDTTISAYYIAGPEGAQCVSVSKVLAFEADGKTPKQLVHLWPLEFPNIAITPEYLEKKNVETKDKRNKT